MQSPSEQSTSLLQPRLTDHTMAASIVVVKHTILNTMIVHYTEDIMPVRWREELIALKH
jgi:hypothetical protein